MAKLKIEKNKKKQKQNDSIWKRESESLLSEILSENRSNFNKLYIYLCEGKTVTMTLMKTYF